MLQIARVNTGKGKVREVDVKDFRTRTSNILDMTKKGNTVVVFRNGRPEAMMVSIAQVKKIYVRLLLDELSEMLNKSG